MKAAFTRFKPMTGSARGKGPGKREFVLANKQAIPTRLPAKAAPAPAPTLPKPGGKGFPPR